MLYLGLSWRKRHPIVTEGYKEFRESCEKSSCIELQLLGFFVFVFLQHLDILKGGVKRKKKKTK